jgi:hypothetical protein
MPSKEIMSLLDGGDVENTNESKLLTLPAKQS